MKAVRHYDFTIDRNMPMIQVVYVYDNGAYVGTRLCKRMFKLSYVRTQLRLNSSTVSRIDNILPRNVNHQGCAKIHVIIDV